MRLFYTAFVLVLISGCIQELDTFKKTEHLLIIDGSISNKREAHTVKLNYTKPFGVNSDYSGVSSATVEIVDDLGNRELLRFKGKDIYQTDTAYQGVIGRFYHVEVTLKSGKKYHSLPEELLPVPEIEEAGYERELVDILTENNVLTTLPRIRYKVRFTDTPGVENFYRWRFKGTFQVVATEAETYGSVPRPINRACPQIINGVVQFRPTKDCWVSDFDNEFLLIESDEFFDGRQVSDYTTFSLEIDRKFSIGYYNLLSQQSLTKEAYEYLKSIKNQISNKGTIFETSNFQIVGNIRSDENPDELVLGYFMVSAVSEKAVFVNARDLPDTFEPKDCTPNNANCLPVTCIDCTKYSSLSSKEKPDFWPLQ